MKCQEICDNLSAYLDNELPAEQAAAVRIHLDQCAECREMLEELRATVDVLDRLPHCPAPEHLAADVQREIERRMLLASSGPAEAQEAPQERTLPMHRANPIPRVLGVAAALVLMTGIGIFAYLTGPGAKHVPVAVTPRGGEIGYGDLTVVRQGTDPGATSAEGKLADAGDKAVLAQRRAGEQKGLGDDALALGLMDKPAETPKHGAATDKAWKQSPDSFDSKEALAKDRAMTPSVEAPAAEAAAPAATAAPAVAPPTPLPATMPAPRPAEPSNAAVKKAGEADGNGDAYRTTGGEPKAEGLAERGGGPRAAALDAAQMQGLIDSVVAGAVPAENLRRMTTQENLKRIENQLVIEARSREVADKDLVRLFAASGLVPLASADRAAARERVMKEPTAKTMPSESEAVAPSAAPADGERPPAGYYYPTHRNGEDIWIVVTDRDNLSRFASQLALADDLTVSPSSSGMLRDVRKLQDQLRVTNGALALGGQAGKGGGRGNGLSTLGAAAPAKGLAGELAGPATASAKSEVRQKALQESQAEPAAEAALEKSERMDEDKDKEAGKSAQEKAAPQPKPAARALDSEIARADPARALPPAPAAKPQAVELKDAEGVAANSPEEKPAFGAPPPGAAPAEPGATVEKAAVGGGAGTRVGRQPIADGGGTMKRDEKTPVAGKPLGSAAAGLAGNAKGVDKEGKELPSGIPWQPNQVILVIRVQQAASADAATSGSEAKPAH